MGVSSVQGAGAYWLGFAVRWRALAWRYAGGSAASGTHRPGPVRGCRRRGLCHSGSTIVVKRFLLCQGRRGDGACLRRKATKLDEECWSLDCLRETLRARFDWPQKASRRIIRRLWL